MYGHFPQAGDGIILRRWWTLPRTIESIEIIKLVRSQLHQASPPLINPNFTSCQARQSRATLVKKGSSLLHAKELAYFLQKQHVRAVPRGKQLGAMLAVAPPGVFLGFVVVPLVFASA